MQPSVDLCDICGTMRSREEEDGDYLLRLDHRRLSELAALPVHLFPTLSEVVPGTRQRMEQLQGTYLEGDPQQTVGQNLQVSWLQEGMVHDERYALSRQSEKRTAAHIHA